MFQGLHPGCWVKEVTGVKEKNKAGPGVGVAILGGVIRIDFSEEVIFREGLEGGKNGACFVDS